MNGILLINKEKNYTSRDVVNIVSKLLLTKKVGHFGTLDPLATGLLVIGVGKYTKIANIIENQTKEYEVEVLIGKSTNTYDITGDVIEEKEVTIQKNNLKEIVLSFKKKYFQEVPIYSSVKVKGKRLYEYARNNETVLLPKKEIEIFDISDFKMSKNTFSFKCLVSKGTYIRSLINDISKKSNIPMCMLNLKRTKWGDFSISDSYKISDIEKGNYYFHNFKLNYKRIEVSEENMIKVKNGNKISNIYSEKRIIFTINNKDYAIYEEKNSNMYPIFFY